MSTAAILPRVHSRLPEPIVTAAGRSPADVATHASNDDGGKQLDKKIAAALGCEWIKISPRDGPRVFPFHRALVDRAMPIDDRNPRHFAACRWLSSLRDDRVDPPYWYVRTRLTRGAGEIESLIQSWREQGAAPAWTALMRDPTGPGGCHVLAVLRAWSGNEVDCWAANRDKPVIVAPIILSRTHAAEISHGVLIH